MTNSSSPAPSPTASPSVLPGSAIPVHQDAGLQPPAIVTFPDLPNESLHLDNPAEQQRPEVTDPAPSSSSPALPLSRTPSYARKPSPGLAARLKALGFSSGSNKAPPPAPQNEKTGNIGRLDEDQLRQLDQQHISNSLGLVVERRGRPWKGPGAPLQRLRSKASRRDISAESGASGRESLVPDEPDLLPEIEQVAPLEMDSNKYRLPDHTNGNGTKAQLDVRRDHIARDSRPPDVDEKEIEQEEEDELAQARPRTPSPPPKDTPPIGTPSSTDYVPDLPSYFNPLGLQRAGSIYTISRASFANQLAQLTALQLPDADLLSSKVAAIPTAQAASKALIGAAEQIRSWISKAAEVISGLDSEDDVEWAAAGGREGYEEVENAITRFEQLINVYVSAIEELQNRPDIAAVPGDDLTHAVMQMDSIMREWRAIRATLNNVKGQVDTAMEWEELWNMVLGDIQNEMDDLSRLVFEMEERRHKSVLVASGSDGVDIGDLATIVEETPPAVARNNRFSVSAFPPTPNSPGTPTLSQDDSSLLALFARMQPLRASLDFLPMRLSVFEARAQKAFPTACEELEMRRTGLEGSYKKLEKDADSLRKELGEDKWVLVFRGAGRQAQKMIESVDRSMNKLRESIDQGLQSSNPAVMGKKIESYEAKKTHYGPAIERVLSIIDRGVKDRLTVNGEILRLHTEMQSKWDEVREQMLEFDAILEALNADRRTQHLRDSISSMLSNDQSTLGSGINTPGSSPPSSVIMSSLGIDPVTPTAKPKNRVSSGSSLPQPQFSRRSSSHLSTPQPRRPLGSRLSAMSSPAVASPSTPARSGSVTPLNSGHPRSASRNADNRPRWSVSTNTSKSDLGHNFKPLSLTTPSPYVKRSPTPLRSASSLATSSRDTKLPIRSPLSREATASPVLERTPSRKGGSRLSFRDRLSASPAPAPVVTQSTLPKPRLTTQASMSALPNRRASLQPPRPQESGDDVRQRPASSLATGRRSSLLPLPRSTKDGESGRQSPQALAGARVAMRRGASAIEVKKDARPRWH
ncbi:cortical protein KAR9-domain-containing protein [Microdochium trichocladiopsis]|uniref:Cortical protein KAR9-domain-containing protein n=1 Tax=Microdochium trichocladiopsis TaxID=1682393 RepID=A0A9P8YAU2_9PEZI|nr:cortical protein KAR9-domain-containing protein [Microdochium trichocladiopsis]KAH7034867.1 cortical protein KAR9-domain-containing protein [Microdochium trichocladiopsis]